MGGDAQVRPVRATKAYLGTEGRKEWVSAVVLAAEEGRTRGKPLLNLGIRLRSRGQSLKHIIQL